jgi:exosome complex RNA-binding protein Rrp42 (RNase PH superfamily)
LCRLLERSIRESDAIDTESLCIISGEKVWCIRCDVRVLDYGGNLPDACSLAVVC